MPPSEPEWATIKRFVMEALELPASDRTGHLETACPDPELRAAAIRLLRACEEAVDDPLLDTPAVAFAGSLIDAVESGEASAIDDLREALADRYVIEREVGRGGMATVYLARDVRHGRDVAVKLLRPEIAVEGLPTRGAARFQREIEIAAGLSHPHILPLYDSGTAGGFLFYVTPFVDGESLRDRLLRSGPPPLADSLRWLRDVARALSYAHRQGLVHRDIKPANILLSLEGDPLVADFGVARGLAAAQALPAPGDAELSDGTLILGTPAYMAPEQVVGAPDIDRRADLYALGVVAYELLTGASPFAGRPRHEQLAAHISEVPAPILSRRPDVPPDLAHLVDRLLAKRPDDRPSDAGEVIEVLNSVITDASRTTIAPGEGASEPPSRRGTRDSEAYELFLKGRHLLGTRQREAMLAALEYFEQAVARDDGFARAFAGMADAWAFLSIFGHVRPHMGFRKARSAAERSIRLDSRLVEGRASLAHILFVYEWSWEAAETALRQVIALDPGYPTLRMYYAAFLHSVGRSGEALAQLEVARELDPLSQTGLLRGRILTDTHRADEAIEVLCEEVALEPRRDLAHECLAHAYLQKGLHEEAVSAMQRAAALSGARDSAQLVYVYARVGRESEARRLLADLPASGPSADLLGFHLAMAHTGLGAADEAFRWLEVAYEERAGFMNLLGVATGFETIREDPRFTDLLRRMGLRERK